TCTPPRGCSSRSPGGSKRRRSMSERECDVRSQILALAELKDGWLAGDGRAYDPAALTRVAALVDRLAAIHTAAVYPSPDGRVRLEWGERPRDDSLEIDPAAGRMAFHL